jgi:hypothetical protein
MAAKRKTYILLGIIAAIALVAILVDLVIQRPIDQTWQRIYQFRLRVLDQISMISCYKSNDGENILWYTVQDSPNSFSVHSVKIGEDKREPTETLREGIQARSVHVFNEFLLVDCMTSIYTLKIPSLETISTIEVPEESQGEESRLSFAYPSEPRTIHRSVFLSETGNLTLGQPVNGRYVHVDNAYRYAVVANRRDPKDEIDNFITFIQGEDCIKLHVPDDLYAYSCVLKEGVLHVTGLDWQSELTEILTFDVLSGSLRSRERASNRIDLWNAQENQSFLCTRRIDSEFFEIGEISFDGLKRKVRRLSEKRYRDRPWHVREIGKSDLLTFMEYRSPPKSLLFDLFPDEYKPWPSPRLLRIDRNSGEVLEYGTIDNIAMLYPHQARILSLGRRDVIALINLQGEVHVFKGVGSK